MTQCMYSYSCSLAFLFEVIGTFSGYIVCLVAYTNLFSFSRGRAVTDEPTMDAYE